MLRSVIVWVVASGLGGCGGLVQAQGTEGQSGSESTGPAPADGSTTASASPQDTGSTADESGGHDGAVIDGSSSSGPGEPASTGPDASSSDGEDEDTAGGPPDCGDGKKGGGEDCDDANEAELDGCTSACTFGPIGLEYGEASTTNEAGGNHGMVTPFSDDCPAGQVLTGLTGRLTSQGLGSAVVLGRIQGECSELSLVNANPTAIDSTPGASLIEHGGFQEGGDWDLTCPDGSVVTAFEGRAGSIIDSLEIACTPLQIDGTGAGQTLELGAPEDEGPVGGNGGASFGPIACPSGEIATGLAGDTNSYVVRLALRCRELALEYP